MSEPPDLDLLREAVAEGGPVTIGHGYAARLVERVEALEGLLREARKELSGPFEGCDCPVCTLAPRIDAALAGGEK